jgi:hypothetical protein
MNDLQFIQSYTLKFKDFDASTIKDKQIMSSMRLKKI